MSVTKAPRFLVRIQGECRAVAAEIKSIYPDRCDAIARQRRDVRGCDGHRDDQVLADGRDDILDPEAGFVTGRYRQLAWSSDPAIPLRVCQGLRLDQQTLSFVTATSPAEAHDDGKPRAFRFGAPREQGIARRQKCEIRKADAAQTRPAT
jgi:hypothetical protein